MKPFQRAEKLLRVLYAARCTTSHLTHWVPLTFRGWCRRLHDHAAGGIYFATNAESGSKHNFPNLSPSYDLWAHAVADGVRRGSYVLASNRWLWLGQKTTYEQDVPMMLSLHRLYQFDSFAHWICVIKVSFMSASNRCFYLSHRQTIPRPLLQEAAVQWQGFALKKRFLQRLFDYLFISIKIQDIPSQ